MVTYEDHLAAIKLRVLSRLEELGLEAQLPSDGVLRIISDEGIEYWGEMEELEEDGTFLQESVLLELKDSQGNVLSGAYLNEKEQKMFVLGHFIHFEGYRLIASHQDGTRCRIGCRGCDVARPALSSAEGEYFIMCESCLMVSPLQEDKWLAAGLWVLGQVENHHG